MSSVQPIPSLNLISRRVGELRAHTPIIWIRREWLKSNPSMSSDQPIPSLNMISIRVGEFRAHTPIIQQSFGFEEGGWTQIHIWVQISQSHHSTWYPVGLGEFRAHTPIIQQNFGFEEGDWIQIHLWFQLSQSHQSTWYPVGLGISEHTLPSFNRTLDSKRVIEFKSIYEFRSTNPIIQRYDNYDITKGIFPLRETQP